MILMQQSAKEAAEALVERVNPGPEFSRALIQALAARMEEEDEWLTPGDFAKATGAHLNSVTKWASTGRIKHTRYPSGRVRGIHVSEVPRMLRAFPRLLEESPPAPSRNGSSTPKQTQPMTEEM